MYMPSKGEKKKDIFQTFFSSSEPSVLLTSERSFESMLGPTLDPTKCDIVSHIWPKRYHRALPVRKDFPYLKIFDHHLSKIVETGILAKMKDDFVVSTRDCQAEAEDTGPEALG